MQFVRLGANAVIQASLRGADLKMIANTINRLVFKLMSKPEVKSAADLKGKTIGVTRLGGSTDFALDLALKKWGLRRGTRHRGAANRRHAATLGRDPKRAD